jgi:hypothetical protein
MRILSDVFNTPAAVIPDGVTSSLQLGRRRRRSFKFRLLKAGIFIKLNKTANNFSNYEG